jgi:hypothetical protein
MTQNRTMRIFSVALWLLLPAVPAAAQFGPTEQRVLTRLTATAEAGKLVIHYRPSSWMTRILPGFKEDQARALAELEKRLGMTYEGKVHVFVYLDVAEMARLTGVQGAGAYSGGRVLHTPFSTLPHHELTHILCLQWNEARNRPVPHDKKATDYDKPEYKFVVEGLADAMTRVGTEGIPIRHWVTFYRRVGAVPPLAKLLASFPNTGTQAPGYWIAGSFLEFLIETQGMRKVKRYYFKPGAMKEIFGKGLAGLEADWQAWLDQTPVDLATMAGVLGGPGGEVVVFERQLRARAGDVRITAVADDKFILELNGKVVGTGDSWMAPKTINARLTGKDTIRVIVINDGGAGGLLLEIVRPKKGAKPVAISDASWKVRAYGKESQAVVLGKPLSGVWAHFATPEARKALSPLLGSWIWRP